MKTVSVSPKSKKAKNRFCNVLNNNPICIVEQEANNKMFLVSENQKYFFWVNITNDEHWSVF